MSTTTFLPGDHTLEAFCTNILQLFFCAVFSLSSCDKLATCRTNELRIRPGSLFHPNTISNLIPASSGK